MAQVDRTDPNWEAKLQARNQQIAESVTKKKPHRESDLDPEWITTKEAIELSGMPRSTFRNRRKEGFFKSYKTPGCYTLRFKYSEVLADSANFWAGGQPSHEPDSFLPHRSKLSDV